MMCNTDDRALQSPEPWSTTCLSTLAYRKEKFSILAFVLENDQRWTLKVEMWLQLHFKGIMLVWSKTWWQRKIDINFICVWRVQRSLQDVLSLLAKHKGSRKRRGLVSLCQWALKRMKLVIYWHCVASKHNQSILFWVIVVQLFHYDTWQKTA